MINVMLVAKLDISQMNAFQIKIIIKKNKKCQTMKKGKLIQLETKVA